MTLTIFCLVTLASTCCLQKYILIRIVTNIRTFLSSTLNFKANLTVLNYYRVC